MMYPIMPTYKASIKILKRTPECFRVTEHAEILGQWHAGGAKKLPALSPIPYASIIS
jgi:hypothetical protein